MPNKDLGKWMFRRKVPLRGDRGFDGSEGAQGPVGNIGPQGIQGVIGPTRTASLLAQTEIIL